MNLTWLLVRPEWHADALCAQADPDAWFPERGSSPRVAKMICRRCEVRPNCLDAALTYEHTHRTEIWGVWGGLTANERRRLRRDAALAVAS